MEKNLIWNYESYLEVSRSRYRSIGPSKVLVLCLMNWICITEFMCWAWKFGIIM